LFLGHHHSQLKNSNRLSLPSHWKQAISGGIYLTQGFDQNLLILTVGAFQEVYLRITSLNITDPLARLLLRMFLGAACFLEMDEKGILLLPTDLMKYANLNGKIVIVGQGDYLEIWSPDQWHQQQSQINDAQSNATRFSAFTIATR
jgi:MraZ protein